MPLKMLFSTITLALACALAMQPLSAQTQPDATQASPSKNRVLTAGDLQAEISDSGQSAPHAVGSSAFASIKIRMAGVWEPSKSKSKTRQKAPDPAGGRIEFEAGQGEITSVTGANVTPSINGERANAQITRLRPGEETTVLVEMRLKASVGEQANVLKVTLKDAAGAASQPAELRWTVRDCAGDYYRELQMISASGGGQLSKLLAELRAPDKSLPRASLFRPGASTSLNDGRCLRYKRRWDPYEDAYRRVCVRYKDGEPEERVTDGVPSPQEEREILQRASATLRNGGADSKLSRNGSLEWVSGKVANDLRVYLGQPHHPALCTGAIQFTDYYLKQAAGLKSHAESAINLAEKARTIAAAKTGQAKQALDALGSEQPGAGLGALPVSERGTGRPLSLLIVALAPYGGLSPEGIAALEQAPDELAMLKALKDGMDANAEPNKAVVAIITPALAMIEAAAYLTKVEAKYQAVRTKFIGGFESVRAAHDKYCVCGG